MKNTPEIITRQLNFAIRAQYLATRNPRALIDLFKTLFLLNKLLSFFLSRKTRKYQCDSDDKIY